MRSVSWPLATQKDATFKSSLTHSVQFVCRVSQEVCCPQIDPLGTVYAPYSPLPLPQVTIRFIISLIPQMFCVQISLKRNLFRNMLPVSRKIRT